MSARPAPTQSDISRLRAELETAAVVARAYSIRDHFAPSGASRQSRPAPTDGLVPEDFPLQPLSVEPSPEETQLLDYMTDAMLTFDQTDELMDGMKELFDEVDDSGREPTWEGAIVSATRDVTVAFKVTVIQYDNYNDVPDHRYKRILEREDELEEDARWILETEQMKGKMVDEFNFDEAVHKYDIRVTVIPSIVPQNNLFSNEDAAHAGVPQAATFEFDPRLLSDFSGQVVDNGNRTLTDEMKGRISKALKLIRADDSLSPLKIALGVTQLSKKFADHLLSTSIPEFKPPEWNFNYDSTEIEARAREIAIKRGFPEWEWGSQLPNAEDELDEKYAAAKNEVELLNDILKDRYKFEKEETLQKETRALIAATAVASVGVAALEQLVSRPGAGSAYMRASSDYKRKQRMM